MSTIVKGKSIVPVKTIKYGGKYDVKQVIDGDECKLEITTAQKGWRTYGKYLCRVVDIDGTILKEEWLNTGDTFTLPELPTNHDRLTGVGWVSSCPDLDWSGTSTVVTKRDIMSGPVYETKSGMIEIIIELNEDTAPNIETDGCEIEINLNGTKYWDYEGDKTVTDTSNAHTYYAYGTYIIAIAGATGYVDSATTIIAKNAAIVTQLYWSSNGPATLLHLATSYTLINLKEISMGAGSIRDIPQNCFAQLPIIKSLILPVGCETLGSSSCAYNCYLENIVIPSTVYTHSSGSYRDNPALEVLVIENCTTVLGATCAIMDFNLQRVSLPVMNTVDGTIPNLPNTYLFLNAGTMELIDVGLLKRVGGLERSGVTELVYPVESTEVGNQGFSECRRLKKVVFKGDITHFSGQAFFSQCTNLRIVDLSNNTVIPTITTSHNAFSGVLNTCKIIVPDELYDEWIVDTNWAEWADYIYKASEVNV